MHYAVPVLFHRGDELAKLFTDLFASKPPMHMLATGISRIDTHSKRARAISARQHPELPPSVVHHFPWFSAHYGWRRRRAASPGETTKAYLWAGKTFNQRILRVGLPDSDVVYGYNSAVRELFESDQTAGRLRVLEQTLVPRVAERKLMDAEARRWRLKPVEDTWSAAYAEREAMEWALADLIVCGSDFVREALIEAGVDECKIRVVPYGVDAPTTPARARHILAKSPLKLLFVGNGGLRKGLPYLLEAVRGLRRGSVELSVVGDVQLPSDLLSVSPDQVKYLGVVPRSHMGEVYREADLFVLPSICEGSATAVYEALTYGLPVICTRSTGSVVKDGFNGRIIPVGDATALRETIESFIEDHSLIAVMGTNAYESVSEFSVTKYSDRLRTTIMQEQRKSRRACGLSEHRDGACVQSAYSE